MIDLMLALAADPVAVVVQEAPAVAVAGDLTVSQGGMMAWISGGVLGGQVMFLVDNAGTGTDSVVSVRTPAGTTGKISVYPVVGGRGDRAPDGDVSIRPGRTGVLVDLTDVASGQPMPVATTLVIVFEHAGEVTISAVPTSPAPPPPPRG